MALQACYLMNTEDKVRFIPWIINSLADAKIDFLAAFDSDGRFPLSRFLSYYLTGRDAVACGVLKDQLEAVNTLLSLDKIPNEDADIRKFWVLVGLIECGAAHVVEAEISKFHPKDSRLLLALHLGCFLIQHHKVVEKDEKNSASNICSLLAERVGHLRKYLISEYKTELLEMQQGKVTSIELPQADSPKAE